MAGTFRIEGREVGEGAPCFVVAEVAQGHDGSLGTAHAYVDAIAKTGADAIKFQTHIANAESTPGEPFRVKFSYQDASRFDYWKRMEFSAEQWVELRTHAREKGLIFLSSPFSIEAIELLDRIGMPAWKIGSGETTNLPLIERVAKTTAPVLLSSGLSSWAELDRATEAVQKEGAPVAVLQCTTSYPCPAERLGLNVIEELRHRYQVPVGFSDHSGTIYAGLAAVALGANLLEVHAVLSRECFGPDVMSSVTTAELRSLVEGTRFIERAIRHPVDKEASAKELTDLKIMFGKSVVAARDLPAGHRIEEKDLALKKPATGIPAVRMRELIGKTLMRALSANMPLSENDLA
jgi:N,N'-diacetyllegionaminate synthase